MRQCEHPGGCRPCRADGPNRSGLAHPGPPQRTVGEDRCRAHGIGAGPSGGHGPRGAPGIPRAARAPKVDHPGVHPSTWPFSTWAVLAVMWHLASEDAPTGTAEEIARDLHAWPQGGLQVAPAAEGFSLAATLQRHPDKRARHFLQTGRVLAAQPDSEWRWDAGGTQPLPDPWILPLSYSATGTLANAVQAVKGAFPQPQLPGLALLRSLQAGAAWIPWREEDGRPSPFLPLVQGQALLHAKGMATVE